MRKLQHNLAAAVFYITLCAVSYCGAEDGAIMIPWKLPPQLDDNNTRISFEVDSTWVTVHGKTSGIHGSVSQEDPVAPETLRGQVILPVAKFDTDNSGRDEHLREVMGEASYKNVVFNLVKLTISCQASAMKDGESCPGQIAGELQIRDIKKSLVIPVIVSRSSSDFKCQGKTSLAWLDYGVGDPSFVLAKLDKIVHIAFEVSFPLAR